MAQQTGPPEPVDVLANDLQLDLSLYDIPRFIAIEGPVGVGKTALAKRLAHTFNYDTLLEQAEENPFLTRFAQDRRSVALPTQLFFLFQRAQQLQGLRQGDMFRPVRVADFLIHRDPLFARVTLDEDELQLYQGVYDKMTIDAPTPDLVIYLQAPTDVLLARIESSGRPNRITDQTLLQSVNEAYTQFFYYYDDSPLLIVNAAEVDFTENEDDYRDLVKYLLTIKSGRHYYNPQPIL